MTSSSNNTSIRLGLITPTSQRQQQQQQQRVVQCCCHNNNNDNNNNNKKKKTCIALFWYTMGISTTCIFYQFRSFCYLLHYYNDNNNTIYNLFFRNHSTNNDEENYNNFHYVELGAFDGYTASNTRFFDQCLGWDGLLIEANPRKYPHVVQNRPTAHRYSFAASCSDNDDNNKTISFWASNFANSAQNNTNNRNAYATGDNNNQMLVNVPCGSITPILLDTFPNGRVHFFSLDVEGAEPDVVSNIDFKKFFIDILISESVSNYCKINKYCTSREQTREILQKNGYILYPNIVTRSDLFVHPNSKYVQSFILKNNNNK